MFYERISFEEIEVFIKNEAITEQLKKLSNE